MTNSTSLAQRSLKNTAYNAMGWIWPIGLSFVCTPYIVHHLGKEAYGVLAIAAMLMGYFSFLNLGLGTAGMKYVSEYYAKREHDAVQSTINTLMVLYLALGSIGMIGILLLANLFATKLFKIPMDMVEVTRFAFYLSAFGLLVGMIRSVFEAVPKALHRFDITNKIGIVFGTATSLLSVFLLYIGHGLKTILILHFGIGLGILMANIVATKRLMPEYKIGFTIDPSLFKKLFSFGTVHLFTKLANLSIRQLGKLVIGILIGPVGVTYYFISQKLVERINGFMYRISEITFPIASELSSTQQNERLREIYIKASRITLAFKLALYVPLALFSYKILYYWMGKEFADQGWLVMVFLGCGFFLVSIGQIPGLFNLGYAKPKYNAVYTFIIALISLSTIYPLTRMMGIKGAALSFLISMIHAPGFVYYVNRKVIKVSNWLFLKKVCIKPLLASMAQAGLIIVLIKGKLITNIGTMLLFFTGAVMSYFIFAYVIGVYEKDEKEQLILFIKSFKIGRSLC